MDDIGSFMRSYILAKNIRMLKDNGIVPGKLPNGYVPVDIDVTPFDNSKTKKQGVSRTYKGCDGYAPIMTYIGTEGYQESIGRCRTTTKHKVRRRRLRTAIGNMIMMAGHVMEHARQLLIRLGRSNPWRHVFAEVYTAFADFRA